MRNAITYYYKLKPNDIHQINKIYKFNILDSKYVLYPCTRTEEEINEIYKLQIQLYQSGYYCHQIILNTEGKITTTINGIIYVLLKTYIEDRRINIDDIISFLNVHLNIEVYENLKRESWYKLWIEKIDYIEYQISQFGKKYKLVRESCDYYIGMVETCISLLANMKNEKNIISISHDRIEVNYSLFDLYNPINFIIDYRVRDFGEYIKSNILTCDNIINEIEKYIITCNITAYEAIILFIRILYPSYYLDIIEQIIDNKKEEKELLQIINKIDIYEEKIKLIYKKFKTIFSIPEIEWLQEQRFKN